MAKQKRLSAAQRKAQKEFRAKWGSSFKKKPESKGLGAWSRSPISETRKRRTFYVVVTVKGKGTGSPPHLEEGETGPATIAILKRRRGGRLTGLTYDELVKDFDTLLEESLRRADLTPAGPPEESVTALFRHKDR